MASTAGMVPTRAFWPQAAAQLCLFLLVSISISISISISKSILASIPISVYAWVHEGVAYYR